MLVGELETLLLCSCPYLAKNVNPAIPVFAAVLFVFVICCILRTACTDPGILPRATPDEILYMEKTGLCSAANVDGDADERRVSLQIRIKM